MEEICCVCGHPLKWHIEETREGWFGSAIDAWWRCHCLAPDAWQCECRLIKWHKQESYTESKLDDYDVDKRAQELIELEK
jgi:hypothetical protein